jgi:hypothetical protein
MTEKNGTIKQCRATRFAKRPASSISSCPFKGPEVAIVPVRYALDRSRHDPAPDRLKPLQASGKWSPLPELTSRRYTLRQLYDGYLYVFDESASTFHEYAVNGANATFVRNAWTQAHLGQDRRAGVSADGKPYLLLLKRARLYIMSFWKTDCSQPPPNSVLPPTSVHPMKPTRSVSLVHLPLATISYGRPGCR